jgi:UDPglucose 6-dehydrogenase
MKIGIIGIGKLGLAFGLNLEMVGHEVFGVDKNEHYIDLLRSGNFKSSEPGVNDAMKQAKNFCFSTDLTSLADCEVIFLVVATPSTSDFKYDHSAVDNVIKELTLLGHSNMRRDLVINCTTFPGYCESVSEKLLNSNFFVSYNPEFIAQGTIMRDQVYCDNVLIGAADELAALKIKEIYRSFVRSTPIYNVMSRTEAELTKLSVNCFLTTKISYANMIGDIALRYKCRPDVVLGAIGTDSRIGTKYLGYGFGFGGPCFPRDNRALAKCASEVGISAEVSLATDRMNELHLEYQIEHFTSNNLDKSQPVIFDFVTYKRESTLLEESQQLKFAIRLKNLGYQVEIRDEREEMLNELNKIWNNE